MSNRNYLDKTTREKFQLVYANWKLFSYLFVHPEGVASFNPERTDVYEQATRGNLAALQKYDLIDCIDGRWVLSDTAQTAIDAFNNTLADATPGRVNGNRVRLQDEVERYRIRMEQGESTDESLRNVIRILRQVVRNVNNALDNIYEDVQDNYSTQSNVLVKKTILEQNRLRLNELRREVMGEKDLGEVDCLYSFMTMDMGLSEELGRVARVYSSRLNTLWSLKVNKTIKMVEEYLVKVNKLSREYRKIQEMYRLYDSGLLEELSDIERYDLLFFPRLSSPYSMVLSLEKELVEEKSYVFSSVLDSVSDVARGFVGRKAGTPVSEWGLVPRKAETSLNIRDDLVDPVFEEYERSGNGMSLAGFVFSFDRFPDGVDFEMKLSLVLEIGLLFTKRLELCAEKEVFSDGCGNAYAVYVQHLKKDR